MEKGGKIVDPVSTAKLYKEWTHLIVEAKKIGLQPNEIREFSHKFDNKAKKH